MKYKKVDAKAGKYRISIYEPKQVIYPKMGVVFGHGSPGVKEFYTWIGEALASRGLLTLLYSVPLTDQLSKEAVRLVRKIIGQQVPDQKFELWLGGVRESVKYLKTKYKLDKIISIGHSMGANACMGEIKNVTSVVALAPGWDNSGVPGRDVVNLVSKTCDVPTLIVVGSEDQITGEKASINHFDQLPVEKKLYILPGGTHTGFLNEGLPYLIAKLFVEPSGTMPIKTQHDLTLANIMVEL